MHYDLLCSITRCCGIYLQLSAELICYVFDKQIVPTASGQYGTIYAQTSRWVHK